MDLPKFLDLVTSEELFFANCATFSDKYEGEIPIRNQEGIKKRFIQDFGYSDEEAHIRMLKQVEVTRRFKEYTLVNCWSGDRNESYALWKIYLGNSSSGVAIKTNAKGLENALVNNNHDIYMGMVSYKDFITDEPNQFNVLTRKSPHYKYEEELRLFILNQFEFNEKEKPVASHPYGLKVQVDLDELISEIYISPFVGDWFEKMLRESLEKVRPSLVGKIKRSVIRDV